MIAQHQDSIIVDLPSGVQIKGNFSFKPKISYICLQILEQLSWGRSLVSTCGCGATFGLKEGSGRQISAQNKQWLELEPTGKWSILSYEVGIPGHLMCLTVY